MLCSLNVSNAITSLEFYIGIFGSGMEMNMEIEGEQKIDIILLERARGRELPTKFSKKKVHWINQQN